MRNLKNNKEAGTGWIHPGLIKYGGNKLLNRVYKLGTQRGKLWPWRGSVVWPWRGSVVKKRTNIFQNSRWKQDDIIDLNNRFKVLQNMEYDNIDNRTR